MNAQLAPAFADGQVRVYHGEASEVLRQLPVESVDCCVTSPPYWGLRDYGIPSRVWGGQDGCDHDWGGVERGKRKDILPLDQTSLRARTGTTDQQDGAATNGGRFCRRCDAWLGCLGLEPTLDLYIAHMVEVFRDVRRVLKNTGTLWLNLGDSYNCGTSRGRKPSPQHHGYWSSAGSMGDLRVNAVGLKVKDLVGVPWRVALALQEDGWYLRCDIVWAKPNPLPESVSDRPTRSHEYVFLLSKSARYFYDAHAVREPTVSLDRDHPSFRPNSAQIAREGRREYAGKHATSARSYNPGGRNRRSVWTIATQPYRGAHFATFPERLVEPCILAGSSQAGCCAACGIPYRRSVKVTYSNPGGRLTNGPRSLERRDESAGFAVRLERHASTTGWEPRCSCRGAVRPAVVLDPFAGSGTTLAVAKRLGRQAIGIELKDDYLGLIRDRCARVSAQMSEEAV